MAGIACLGATTMLPAATSASPTDEPASAPRAEHAAKPMSLDEVASLLEAGVGEPLILRHVRATETRLAIDVEALLRLKAAGASDAFLEALISEGSDVPGGPETPSGADREPAPEAPRHGAPENVLTNEESSIRLFVLEDDSGERIVHITNLDEHGRRLGGELPPEARRTPNVIAPGVPGAAPPRSYDGSYADAPAEPPATPVVVNVYPPEPPAPAPYLEAPDPGHYGAFVPTGVYPGYFNQAYAPYPYPSWGYPGARYGLGGVVYSPPGSYSHFIRYHRPPGSHVFHRYTGYTVHGTRFNNAAARNRQYFGKR